MSIMTPSWTCWSSNGWCDGGMRRIDDLRVRQQISPRRTQPWAKTYKDPCAAPGAQQLTGRPHGPASLRTTSVS